MKSPSRWASPLSPSSACIWSPSLASQPTRTIRRRHPSRMNLLRSSQRKSRPLRSRHRLRRNRHRLQRSALPNHPLKPKKRHPPRNRRQDAPSRQHPKPRQASRRQRAPPPRPPARSQRRRLRSPGRLRAMSFLSWPFPRRARPSRRYRSAGCPVDEHQHSLSRPPRQSFNLSIDRWHRRHRWVCVERRAQQAHCLRPPHSGACTVRLATGCAALIASSVLDVISCYLRAIWLQSS
mmetsp:Transcript_47310/g.94332  ORF Transcript_47310/g.94332 Transcript_47310/m.94332 type:complete len:236 (+) Transcript_47310:70-777(+)